MQLPTLPTIALALCLPTACDAHGPGGFHPGFHGHHGWGGPGFGFGLMVPEPEVPIEENCWRRREYWTPYGPRSHWVRIC